MGYEKHHHKHLGWSMFSATHIKIKSSSSAFSCKQTHFFFLIPAQVDLNSASASSIAQPQTSVQSCLIRSQLNRDQIWPFFKLRLQLLPPLRNALSRSLSSVTCPQGDEFLTLSACIQRKKALLSLCLMSAKREEERLLVKVAQGANWSWLAKLSEQPRFLQPPPPSL